MPKKEFCHLHFHTEYSLLDGACRIKDAVKKAKKLGMPALAITDHGVLHGAIPFYNAARAAGIKPIIGCEMYVSQGDMREKKKNEDGSQSNHLLLLAKDVVGYQNLAKLTSLAHTEGYYYKPRIDKELLARHSEGLIGTSGCLKGEVPEFVVNGHMDKALARTGEYQDILGKENYYMELMDHGLREQHQANAGVLEISKKLGIPLIASNDVHYINHEHHEAHDVMLCLQTQTVMSDPKRLRYQADQFYMKTAEEMYDLFKDHPEALTNTLKIADQCNLELKLGLDAPLHFPKFTLPEGHTEMSYLIQIGKAGLRKHYGVANIDHPKNPDEKEIADRFYYEVRIIDQTGFLNYFLVVWDFINYAKQQKIPVGPGRGSGAGSLLAYALGITGIDPLQYNLIFERFLNPDRISPPDFDIDFCQYRRGEVIEYVKDKYGRENCAQIITFGTLGAKMVIRDIGRVLEIPLPECDRLAKLVPEDPGMTLAKALKASPDFKKATQTEPNAREIMKYATVLEGLPRNQGTHAAGVVIGEKPLEDIIPMCRDKEKQTITQYEMKPLEMTGLLKMDFLGLKTLTVVQEAIDNVKEMHGVELDVETMPFDDAKTFALLNRGDTVGVFQVESKGMRDLLRQFKLTKFEDLIAMIALYRPGPMDMIPDFVKRRHGQVKIKYPHPLLEPILEETFGVFIYQEQIQQASAALAGFTLAQGDLLRRAMGKKDDSIMAEMQQKFLDGCMEANSIPARQATEIFNTIRKFAEYGFNKSHSTAYAFISWHTAYLKANYPLEFMAALMSCEMGNPDKLAFFIAEAQTMGINVLPPSVNAGGARFKPDGGDIRFGMAGIKNVGAGAVEALVAERRANGPFESLTDFCMRLNTGDVNKKVLEALIMCGAFDWTGMYRSRMFNGVEFVLQRAAATLRDKAAGQGSLFDMLEDDTESTAHDDLPECEAWPESVMLKHEKELAGFYITGHPLNQYQWVLDTFSTWKTADLAEAEPKAIVRVGGLIAGYRKLFTKKTQEPMAAFQVECLDGGFETVMFPETFRTFGDRIADNETVMLVGEKADEDDVKIMVSEAYPLADVPNLFSEYLTIRLESEDLQDEKLTAARELIQANPGDIPVFICVVHPEGPEVSIKVAGQLTIAPTAELVRELGALFGDDRITLAVQQKPGKREPQKRNFGRRQNGS